MGRIPFIQKFKQAGWLPWGILIGLVGIWCGSWYVYTHQNNAYESVSWVNAPPQHAIHVTVTLPDGSPGSSLLFRVKVGPVGMGPVYTPTLKERPLGDLEKGK